MTETLYRIVRMTWFDEHGMDRQVKYQVQKFVGKWPFERWVTITHSYGYDSSRTSTEFDEEVLAEEFIMHLISGGAVQKWVSEVLPGDFG